MAVAMDPALQMHWQALRARVKTFLRWWTGELLGMTPQGLRQLVAPAHPVLAIDMKSGEVSYHSADGHSEVVGSIPLDASATVKQQHLAAILHRRLPRGIHLALTLPGVLRRRIEMPAAAENDLDSVLRLDMDRQTPFKADDILFTYRVVTRQREAGTINVDLVVVPHENCNASKQLADELGLPVAYLGPANGPPWHDNLYAQSRSPAGVAVRRIAGVVAVLLSGAALWLPLELDRRHAEAAAKQLTQVRALEAELTAELEKHAPFLGATRALGAERIRALKILSDITAALPEDAWLDRLDWRADRVEITGRAGAAAAFTARLNQWPGFQSVEYLTPVTKGPEGLERFSLLLRLASEDETSPYTNESAQEPTQ